MRLAVHCSKIIFEQRRCGELEIAQRLATFILGTQVIARFVVSACKTCK